MVAAYADANRSTGIGPQSLQQCLACPFQSGEISPGRDDIAATVGSFSPSGEVFGATRLEDDDLTISDVGTDGVARKIEERNNPRDDQLSSPTHQFVQ